MTAATFAPLPLSEEDDAEDGLPSVRDVTPAPVAPVPVEVSPVPPAPAPESMPAAPEPTRAAPGPTPAAQQPAPAAPEPTPAAPAPAAPEPRTPAPTPTAVAPSTGGADRRALLELGIPESLLGSGPLDQPMPLSHLLAGLPRPPALLRTPGAVVAWWAWASRR